MVKSKVVVVLIKVNAGPDLNKITTIPQITKKTTIILIKTNLIINSNKITMITLNPTIVDPINQTQKKISLILMKR